MRLLALLPDELVNRMDALLRSGEPRTEFIRAAIRREIEYREKQRQAQQDKKPKPP